VEARIYKRCRAKGHTGRRGIGMRVKYLGASLYWQHTKILGWPALLEFEPSGTEI